jgi:hypothetical protein
MSTFTVGADTASFLVYDQGFRDSLVSTIEEWTLPIMVSDAATWGLLNTLRSPKELVTIRTIAGQVSNPPQVVIDIGGGGGQGTLTVDNLDAHTAILVGLDRTWIAQDGSSLAVSTWLITG